MKGETLKATENSVSENAGSKRRRGGEGSQRVREWEKDPLCYRNPLMNVFS